MTLYDTRMGSIYGDVSGIPAQVQERKMLAQRLLLNPEQMPQGQMISGHYVPPSWTQQLASAIKGPLARSELNAANKQLGEYNDKKRQDIAAILSGQSPQTIQTGGQQSMPAYTPDQMDRFGSPMPGAQREPITTQQTRTETPEEVQARLRPLIYQAASQYGNDPALQLMLGDLNYGRQRADTKADLQDNRQYSEGRESVKREQQLQDVAANQEFQRILMKEQQGFQTTQQEKQFAQQYQMMNAQQGFQAQQQANQQKFASGENALNRQATLNAAQAKNAQFQNPQQMENARLTAQQALDQASEVFNHAGKERGTGFSSFMSSIPGTEAKGFQANLDAFRAQTFIPMVQSLKGMGALSDAEGKKLMDAVGALDPSMPEEEFNKNMKKVARDLYSKARASGLNVNLPQFAAEPVGATGEWSITPVGK